MRLLKCYIENFGTLKNFTYNFNDGLNYVKEENGFGKTTFATFIKSMFYGLDTSVNVKTEKSDRKKYYPWQGGMYGGNIEFEIKNKKYRIERFFGKKPTEDTFKLFDLNTNLESKDYSENIGEEIFKINKSAYERSTYIPQGQIQIDMEDSMSAKLGNVLESENDINTSEEALNKIKDAKKVYKKDKGKGGLIDEKKDKLHELERKLENSKNDLENLEIRRKQLDEKIKEIKQNEEARNRKQKLLSLKIEQDRNKAKQETYKTLIERYNKSEKQYYDLKHFFKDEVPTDEKLKNIITINSELEKINAEINNSNLSNEESSLLENLNNSFYNKNISIEQIEDNIINYSKIQQVQGEIQKKQIEYTNMEKQLNLIQTEIKKKETFSKAFYILEIIVVIIGICMIVFNLQKVLGTALLVLTPLLFAFNFSKVKNKSAKQNYINSKEQLRGLNDEIEILKNKQNNMENQINKMLKSCEIEVIPESNKILLLTDLKERFSQYQKLLLQKTQREEAKQKVLIHKQEKIKEIEEFLFKYYEKVNTNYSELIQQLMIKKNEFKNIEQQFISAKNEKEKYESQNDTNTFKSEEQIIEESENELKESILSYNNKLDGLVDEKNQIKNQIEVLENKIDENEYLETDIESLKEEIQEVTEKYTILKNTEELLKTAKESFSSSYLKEMVNGFNKYLGIINNKSLNTNVDIKLDVKVDVNGSQKEIKYFSAGYKDLIYICMRLSLINALFKDELPFIVLDDPLVNLDEEKTKKALDVIKAFAKEYQVIYLVCNSSRVLE